jgi:4-hydroxybutyrate CoA-transferase
VDYVVTEHGVAQLKGKRLRERAEALLEIADPTFRPALEENLRDLRGESWLARS